MRRVRVIDCIFGRKKAFGSHILFKDRREEDKERSISSQDANCNDGLVIQTDHRVFYSQAAQLKLYIILRGWHMVVAPRKDALSRSLGHCVN